MLMYTALSGLGLSHPPTAENRVRTPGIPPTAVGGWFKPSLHIEGTWDSRFPLLLSPRAARGEGDDKKQRRGAACVVGWI